MNSNSKRIYFIDWLRIIAVALLIPHHAAITFSYIGDTYVYAPVRDLSPYFFIQSFFLNIWFMRLLFLVSGFSAWYSLRKRSNVRFFRDRVKRTVIPLVFGICVICPPMAFLRARQSYGFEGNFIAFYPEFFHSFASGKYLGWGHLWFLAYLFVYSAFLALCRSSSSRNEKTGKQIPAPCVKHGIFSTGRIIRTVTGHPAIPLLYCVIVEMVFRPFFPGKQNLYADWANFLIYGFFFYYGYLIAAQPELLDRISAAENKMAVTALCTFICFLILNAAEIYSFWPGTAGSYPYAVFKALFRGTAEYTWVMFILAFARKHLDSDGKLRRSLSSSSFALYLFHYTLLSYVMYALIRTSWHPALLFVMGIGITYSLFFICYELIIRRIAIFRWLCGIKKRS